MAVAKKQAVKKTVIDDNEGMKKASKTKKDPAMKEENITSGKYEDIHFVDSTKNVWNYSLLTDELVRNFQAGTLYNAYDYLGSHEVEVLGKRGYYFAVWAPNATAVSVKGNFNNWKNNEYALYVRIDNSGIWEGFIPEFPKGEV